MTEIPSAYFNILVAAYIVGGISIFGAFAIGAWMWRQLGVSRKREDGGTVGLITGTQSPAKEWLRRNEKR